MLATNQTGGGVDIAMKVGLRKHGLIDKRDYTVIETPLPGMPEILNQKKADLITAVMPFALNPMLNQIGFPLYDLTEGLGTSQFLIWTARQAYINKHRAVLVDFMEDMLRIDVGILTQGTTPRWQRSLRIWSRYRPTGSAGCSQRRTTIAIRT